MTLLGSLRAAASIESPSLPLTSSTLLDFLGIKPSRTGVQVTEKSALGVPAAWRAVSLIASTGATLPLHAYKVQGEARVRVSGGNAAALLARPHPDLTPVELLELVFVALLLWGNAYLLCLRDQTGVIRELWWVAPTRVKATRDSDTGRKAYVIDGDLERPARDVHQGGAMLHIPGLGYDGVVGASPIRVAREAFGMAIAAEEYGARLFGSGGLATGILTTEQRLTPDQAAEVKKLWKAGSNTGLTSAHDIRVIGSGATFQQLSIPPEDAQFIESRRFQITEIARIFGVPPHMLGETEKATSWGCLPGDALVLTTHGPVPIQDVAVGTEVWSFSQAGGMESGKVTGWTMTGHKPLTTIYTRGRALRATPNHRVPVRRYFGRAAGRRPGECAWETVEVAAGEIRVGDYLLVPHGMGDGDRDVAPDGRQLTISAMELCGLYLGDGSQDGNRIEIAHEVDADHMPYYVGAISSEFGVAPYVDKRGTRTRFSSVDARALFECGFTGTALTKRVPGWVFRLRRDLQLAFLRGYLDADGTAQGGVLSFSSANRLLLEDVRHLCMLVGVPVGRVIMGRAGGPTVIHGRTYVSQPKYQLGLSSKAHNGAVGSNSPRKASRIQVGAGARRLRYDAGWRGGLGQTHRRVPASLTPGGEWALGDVVLHRVVAVEVGSVEVPVYDIEVEGLAHFVSDGVVVHNTGIEQQNLGFITYTLRPWLSRVEERISRMLRPEPVYARFSVEGLLRGDSEQRAKFYRQLWEVGALSTNDILALEERPPVEGGDARYVPLNFGLLGQDSSAPEAAPADPTPVARGRRAPIDGQLEIEGVES